MAKGIKSGSKDLYGRERVSASIHSIPYVVLIRGVPLRIANDPNQIKEDSNDVPPKFYVNNGSVDTEVALLLAPPDTTMTAYLPNPYYDKTHWDGFVNKFPSESSVGQIFISDNQDKNLKQNCQVELNTGNIIGKTITDSTGNGSKGLLMGDYKVKKVRKGEPMRRDSFIKVPKKTGNKVPVSVTASTAVLVSLTLE